jgi:hypothetical protein
MVLWFLNIELTRAGAQGTSFEPEDFSRTVLSAYFPPGLLKHPNNPESPGAALAVIPTAILRFDPETGWSRLRFQTIPGVWKGHI